jgi:hypothetical protein
MRNLPLSDGPCDVNASRHRNCSDAAMTSFKPARLVTLLGLPVFLLALAAPAWSQESPGFAKEGTFVGVSALPGFTLDGLTFDGSTAYRRVDGDEILILPRLDRKNMVRGIVGFRSSRGSFEVSYDQTNHTGTFLGVPGWEATFHSINGDERIFLVTRKRIQPYVLLGGSIPWITIKNGSFLDPDIGDASFRGFGVNTEAGVTVFALPRVGISAGYRYRAMWFDSASGVTNTTYKLRPRFRETSGSVVISAQFAF